MFKLIKSWFSEPKTEDFVKIGSDTPKPKAKKATTKKPATKKAPAKKPASVKKPKD